MRRLGASGSGFTVRHQDMLSGHLQVLKMFVHTRAVLDITSKWQRFYQKLGV